MVSFRRLISPSLTSFLIPQAYPPPRRRTEGSKERRPVPSKLPECQRNTRSSWHAKRRLTREKRSWQDVASTYVLYARIFAYLKDLLVLRCFHRQIDRLGTFASLSHCRNKAKIRRFSPLLWSIPMTKHESTKRLGNVSVIRKTKEELFVDVIICWSIIFNDFGNFMISYFLVIYKIVSTIDFYIVLKCDVTAEAGKMTSSAAI